MNQKELIKKINKFCDHFDNAYALNCGGCCYVAAVIAETRAEMMARTHRQRPIRLQPSRTCSKISKFKNIKYKVRYCDCPTHYVIEVNRTPLNLGVFDGDYDYLEKWNSSDLYKEYYSGRWNNLYSTKLNGVVKMSIRNIFKCYKGRPLIKKRCTKKII